uniref:Signaling lymphocytic activation molecule n=1 Tax=Anas zonorhyncha TaxID=75864 RepID=A0A8B9U1D5_9AVES
MGCSVCLWLVVSFCRVWGMGRGTRETVLGTLGKATVLWIPQEFQNLTQSFGMATWKRDTADPHSKEVLLKYMNGNYTNYAPSQNHFHSSNFSLEILSTQRQDQRLYEYIISKDAKEKVWQIQLEVYEPVSDPDIQVLSWALANDSCTVTLNCTAARGDNVSYSWTGLEASSSSPCAHNGSLLHLSYHLNATSLACSCTASNPVSSSTVTFNSSACSFEQWGSASPGLNLVLVVVPIVVALVLFGVFTALHVGRLRKHTPLPEDNEVRTIYSQVQRVEVREPSSGTGGDAWGAAAWVRAAGKEAAPQSCAGCALVALPQVGFSHWVSMHLMGAEPGRWRDHAHGGTGGVVGPWVSPPSMVRSQEPSRSP